MVASFSITRITALWGRLNSSFWFVPTVMALGAMALSFVLIQVDVLRDVGQSDAPGVLYTFGPEGARAILSVIASSMITVASLIFSITMLSLQLASSQFGPRVLGNFMRDRSNQIVLGTFISTFIYCLFVLRSVRGTDGASFVPHLAVGFGVVLAAISVAVLIYFIHHIATSIRVETLLEKLTREGCASVDRLFPEQLGKGLQNTDREAIRPSIPGDYDEKAERIGADSNGYVQNIGVAVLMHIATKHDLLLRIDAPPGQFVTKGDCVIAAYPMDRMTDEIDEDLRGAVVIGQDRTAQQDLEFAIRRIVELAQRSLSPGINDPTTALYCIDRLGQVLGRLAEREVPSPMRSDPSGQLRVITDGVVIEQIICRAFAAIARYGMSDVDVILRLVDTIAKLEGAFPRAIRTPLKDFREHLLSASSDTIPHDFDRKLLGDLQDARSKATTP